MRLQAQDNMHTLVSGLPGYSVIWLFGEDKRDFLLIAAT